MTYTNFKKSFSSLFFKALILVYAAFAFSQDATSQVSPESHLPQQRDQQHRSEQWNLDNYLITDTEGMEFFNPAEVLERRKKFQELPEMEDLNSYKNESIKKISNFMQSEGIALGLGVNPNRDSFFNLYDPTSVDILVEEPAAEFGLRQKTFEAEVGKMHYITHDAVHMYAGQVGPRLEDIETPEKLAESKERLIRILLEKEAIGSAFSTAHHARWYWNWRHKNSGGQNRADFEQHNSGAFSIGKLSNNDWMDLLQATLHGKIWQYFRVMQKNVDYNHYKRARSLGVPMLFPSLEEKLTPTGEKLLIKYGMSAFAAVANYFFPKTGYKNFRKFAEIQAELYYSPWYVRWADAFKIGYDLNTMENHLENIADDFRKDRFMHDAVKPATGIFELMHIKNGVIQFGRKIVELLELNKKYPETFSPSDLQDLEKLLQRAIDLNDFAAQLKSQNRALSKQEVLSYKSSVLNLMKSADQRFPVDKTIPVRLRVGHADYNKFWFDSFAVVLDRPEGLTKFLSTKVVWRAALKQRIARQLGKKDSVQEGPITIDTMTHDLAEAYNKRRKGKAISPVTTEKTIYLNYLETFRKTLQAQVYKVFIPQVQEYQHISDGKRIEIIDLAEEFAQVMEEKLEIFKGLYIKRYVEYSRSRKVKKQLDTYQTNMKWAVERSLSAMIDILDDLDKEQDKTPQLERGMKIIRENLDYVKSGRQIKPSIADRIKITMPMNDGFTKLAVTKGADLIRNKKLTKFIDSLPLEPFSRDHRPEPDIEVVDANGKKLQAKLPHLPENAVVFLAMNHDHPALDARYINLVAKKLGIDRSLLLTDKEAWPQYEIHANRDPNVFFIQDRKFKKKAMDIMEQHNRGKVGFMIFPEGGLPFWGTQFPMMANFGAFSMARKTARRLEGKKPVYFVEINGNFLSSITSSEKEVPVKLSITEPAKVPTGIVGKRDPWVEKMRERFEKNINSPNQRGKQYDLIDRRPDEKVRFRRVNKVREYVPTANVMEELSKAQSLKYSGSAALTCRELLSH